MKLNTICHRILPVLSTLGDNIKEVSIKQHHMGKGHHIQIIFANNEHASITTNTGETNDNNTYELYANTEVVNTEDGTRTHLFIEELTELLIQVSQLEDQHHQLQ